MNINRDNYETYFLLYVDNELPAADRSSVEIFVQENPDLKAELNLLVGTTLPAENFSFTSKMNLLRKDPDLDNIREKLLSHLDNELEPQEALAMTTVIATDDQVREEWNSLQRLKLDTADTVIFENKALLYRHEGSRVVAFRFWKIAAAAAVLFALLFSAFFWSGKNNAGDPLVNNSGVQSRESQKKLTPGGIPGTQRPIVSHPEPATKNNNSSLAGNVQKQSAQDALVSPVPVTKGAAAGKQSVAIQVSAMESHEQFSKLAGQNINSDTSNKTLASAVSYKESNPGNKDKLSMALASITTSKVNAPTNPFTAYKALEQDPNDYAKRTVLDDGQESNTRILSIDEDKISRSKIGGIFKKVKRVIERNTNIKTGNSVRVAGFEIALK